jgi:hypothetical protein
MLSFNLFRQFDQLPQGHQEDAQDTAQFVLSLIAETADRTGASWEPKDAGVAEDGSVELPADQLADGFTVGECAAAAWSGEVLQNLAEHPKIQRELWRRSPQFLQYPFPGLTQEVLSTHVAGSATSDWQPLARFALIAAHAYVTAAPGLRWVPEEYKQGKIESLDEEMCVVGFFDEKGRSHVLAPHKSKAAATRRVRQVK